MASPSLCCSKEASKFLSTRPRFFKIIHDNNITQGKLVIPRKFIQNYGNNLKSPVLLKVPSGTVWEVELRKCGDEVWLQEGWQDFAKYYSLGHGNLLVFEYEGNCDFSVLIFDKTATEIEYSLNSTHSQEHHQGGEFKQPNMDKTENISSGQKTREKPPSICPHPRKIRRTTSTSSTANVLKPSHSELPNGADCGAGSLENVQRDVNPHCGTSQPQEANSFSCKKRRRRKRKSWRVQRMAECERAKALQGACEFKSKNPFFKVVMQTTHVHTTYSLTVSESFAAKYFSERRGDVNLCVSGGRTWPAKYYTTKCGRRMQTKIFHGWREFAKDMHLEVGDVCVFELINATTISINVAIFRHIDLGEPRQLALQKICDSQVVQEPLLYQDATANPSFEVSIQLYHLKRSTVNVPARFMRGHADNRHTAILRATDNDISWPIDMRSYTSKNVLSGAGWRAFAEDNTLQLFSVTVVSQAGTARIASPRHSGSSGGCYILGDRDQGSNKKMTSTPTS